MRLDIICFIRVLIGSIFILSGFSKVIDSDGFILRLIGYGFGMFSYIGAIVPPIEIILGLFLILNAWTRSVAFVVFILTFLFTLAFGYGFFFRAVKDCGCFGDWISLSPAAAFIRNILIMVGALFVWQKAKDKPTKKWELALVTIIGAFSFAMGGFTVDNSLTTALNLKSLTGKKLSQAHLKSLDLETGKNVVFVFSVCKKSTPLSVFDFKDNADASVCTGNRAFEDFEMKSLYFCK